MGPDASLSDDVDCKVNLVRLIADYTIIAMQIEKEYTMNATSVRI
jgi:hypothetical protein